MDSSKLIYMYHLHGFNLHYGIAKVKLQNDQARNKGKGPRSFHFVVG